MDVDFYDNQTVVWYVSIHQFQPHGVIISNRLADEVKVLLDSSEHQVWCKSNIIRHQNACKFGRKMNPKHELTPINSQKV